MAGLTLCPREVRESAERDLLAPGAALSAAAKRARREEPDNLRPAYQRDRDRILHAKAFRRLKGKTQVFIAPEGDHYRTRLTHTLEVTQVARTIGRALRLNEDLVEAIGLGHDLGHTPFGHAGERALDKVLANHGKRFHHAVQSARIVGRLARGGRGLNLCLATVDGILRHTKGLADLDAGGPLPATLEGQVVRVADRIAYVNHDLEDACRAGVLAMDEIPGDLLKTLGRGHGERIGRLVEDVVATSRGQTWVALSPPMRQALDALKDFMFERVYLSPAQRKLGKRAGLVVAELFRAAYNGEFSPEPVPAGGSGRDPRLVADWIAGMTDAFALRLHREISTDKALVWEKTPGRLGL
ncbi:deoxyguanosinetriphosphate triphosphohydrolase [bacterium]|nr:deoxyguanosinetriphosphate triphosphohydrolase [bacterium]